MRSRLTALPYLLIFGVAAAIPLAGDDYVVLIATRAAVYWVLVSGLNLVVGFAGQLAIGWVSLLTIGAYTTSVIVARGWLGPLSALVVAGLAGALAGAVVGLPALRLRTFYFAMTTLGFATIVTQVALAWTDVTGGGIGIGGPALPAPLDTQIGFYLFCLALAALCTWMTLNIAASRFGRALVGLRDAEVAAEAMGISKARLLLTVFLFSGALAAVAGELFATLQSYITPDAFTFDLSVLFFSRAHRAGCPAVPQNSLPHCPHRSRWSARPPADPVPPVFQRPQSARRAPRGAARPRQSDGVWIRSPASRRRERRRSRWSTPLRSAPVFRPRRVSCRRDRAQRAPIQTRRP